MPGKAKISARFAVALVAAVVLGISAAFAASTPISADEATLERNFDALIQPNQLRDWMKLRAAQPNHVSSPHDKSNAEQILAWFK
ncbi:MAG: hypothetical protein WBP68_04930, partial [Candidatus Binatus sp.]